MTDHVKVVAPRAPTQAPNAARRITGRLPDELLSAQVDRLAVFSAVICGLWGFGVAVNDSLVPLLLGRPRRAEAITLELCGLAVSAAMYLYVRHTNASFG